MNQWTVYDFFFVIVNLIGGGGRGCGVPLVAGAGGAGNFHGAIFWVIGSVGERCAPSIWPLIGLRLYRIFFSQLAADVLYPPTPLSILYSLILIFTMLIAIIIHYRLNFWRDGHRLNFVSSFMNEVGGGLTGVTWLDSVVMTIFFRKVTDPTDFCFALIRWFFQLNGRVPPVGKSRGKKMFRFDHGAKNQKTKKNKKTRTW